MDVLRGSAILLMVLYHSTEVLWRYAEPAPGWLVSAMSFFAPVRMPALMFLSGMLLQGSLSKGPRRYVSGKLRRIAYPFLLWTLIYLALTWTWEDAVGATVGAQTYLWFMQFLVLFYLLALAVRPVPQLPVILGSLAAAWVLPTGSLAERFLFLFGFFLLGDVLAQRPATWRAWVSDLRVVSVATVLGVAVGVVSLMGTTVRYQAEYAVGTLGGIIALGYASRLLDRTPLATPLRYVGRNSLVFFVVHWPVMVIAVRALQLAGAVNPLVLAAAAIVGALAAGALATAAAPRYREVDALFTAPSLRRRAPTAPA